MILAQAQAKDADDISEDDSPVNEVEEFMMICGEREQALNDNPLPSNVPQQEFEMIQVVLNRLTGVAVLKGIATLFSLSTNAPKKEVLFNHISDSPHVTKISDTPFEYRQAKTNVSGGVKIPTWILLTPEKVPPVAGVDMGTGAQIGFFGPTNQENAVGATAQIS